MEIKKISMVTAEGKRNVKVANSIRVQMFDKIASVLKEGGFDVTKAANGDIAVKTCIDEVTGDIFFTRLTVALSSKALDSKLVKKTKEKEAEVPTLFNNVDTDTDEEDAE